MYASQDQRKDGERVLTRRGKFRKGADQTAGFQKETKKKNATDNQTIYEGETNATEGAPVEEAPKTAKSKNLKRKSGEKPPDTLNDNEDRKLHCGDPKINANIANLPKQGSREAHKIPTVTASGSDDPIPRESSQKPPPPQATIPTVRHSMQLHQSVLDNAGKMSKTTKKDANFLEPGETDYVQASENEDSYENHSDNNHNDCSDTDRIEDDHPLYKVKEALHIGRHHFDVKFTEGDELVEEDEGKRHIRLGLQPKKRTRDEMNASYTRGLEKLIRFDEIHKKGTLFLPTIANS